MNRLPARVLLLAVACAFPALAAGDDPREALKALNDFVGDWNGGGGPPRGGRSSPRDVWSEKLSWGWKFKGDDARLTLKVVGGKHVKGGDLRYLPGKKTYELTLEDVKGRKYAYQGDLKNDVLTLERTDPATKDTHRLTMNTAADGVRLIYRSARKRAGTTLYVAEYEVACNREGESLARAAKKNECVVTGGLGTMTVGHKGRTYYVCCSGCRDAFNDNPEKYIKEYEASKKKKAK